MKHTALPWHWWIEDHSMATLSGQDELRDHVMSVSPCKNCIVEGESPFGKCTMPSEADAAFIVQACNSHDDMVKALTNLAEYAAHEIGLQVADCVAGPIGEASAALKRAKGEA